MAHSVKKSKGRQDTRSFAGIPRPVMDHPDYLNLSGTAVKLLIELAYQYKGRNNGDLATAWGVMRHRGFKSKATLSRATQELVEARMVIRTREGVFTNPGGKCALYALSWQPVDHCDGKHNHPQTVTPPRKFTLE